MSTNSEPNAAGGEHDPPNWKVSLVLSLVTLALVIVLKLMLEAVFPPFEHFRLWVYSEMQNGIRSEEQQIPVVVDLSDLRNAQPLENVTETPRRNVLALIREIAKYKPEAIGVDVDFSPADNGPITANGVSYITAGDPVFFNQLLQITQQTHIPIFLGIGNSVVEQPEKWLGEPGYKGLAANIWIPKKGAQKMPLWIKTTAIGVACPSMAAALTRQTSTSTNPTWWALRERMEEDHSEKEVTVAYYPVDYSPLKQLMTKYKLRTLDPQRIAENRDLFAGRIVLLGYADIPLNDVHPIGIRPESEPGIYIHACAAYTLGKQPLYELTTFCRILLDALVWLLALLVVVLMWIYCEKKGLRVSEEHARGRAIILVFIFTLLGQFLLIRMAHVLWDDFLLILLAIPFHNRLHGSLGRLHDDKSSHAQMLKRIGVSIFHYTLPVDHGKREHGGKHDDGTTGRTDDAEALVNEKPPRSKDD